jgi:predicted component of type VI protein secretion system
VDQGPDQGRVFALDNRTVVGSAEGVQIRLQSTFPQHLELARHDNGFWVRDLTGQAQTYRAGVPLGADFALLADGDLLLLSGQVMLRFAEDT